MSDLSCRISGYVFLFLSKPFVLSYGVFFQFSCLYSAFSFCPCSGLGKYFAFMLQAALLPLDWVGGQKHLYFLLGSTFWLLIPEFSVGSGRERFRFGHLLSTKISEGLCSGFCPDTAASDCYVNLLNFELFYCL